MSPDQSLPTRRAVVLGGLSMVALAGCGGSGDESDTADPAPSDASEPDTSDSDADAETAAGALFLVPGFADGLRTPPALTTGTPQRAPMFLVDGNSGGPVFDGAPESLTLDLLLGDAVIATSDVPVTGADVGKAYYPLLFEVDEAGEYEVRGEIDGSALTATFRVVDASEVGTPAVGDQLISAETPTFDDARDVDPICTRSPDPCPFHDRSLTEVVGTMPVVLLISTPAYCQTAICGPVLEMLIEELDGNDDIAAVHAEVWRNEDTIFEPGGETELMTEYGMTYEPALFVADADGVITARLDFTWGRDEMLAALATVS